MTFKEFVSSDRNQHSQHYSNILHPIIMQYSSLYMSYGIIIWNLLKILFGYFGFMNSVSLGKVVCHYVPAHQIAPKHWCLSCLVSPGKASVMVPGCSRHGLSFYFVFVLDSGTNHSCNEFM